MNFLGTGSEYQNMTELAQNLVLSLALVIGMFCHHNVGLYETEGSRCDKYYDYSFLGCAAILCGIETCYNNVQGTRGYSKDADSKFLKMLVPLYHSRWHHISGKLSMF